MYFVKCQANFTKRNHEKSFFNNIKRSNNHAGFIVMRKQKWLRGR